MSSITMRSLRQMRATTRLIDASTLARPMVRVSDSRVNQATRRPASMTAWARASTKFAVAPNAAPASAPPDDDDLGRAGGPVRHRDRLPEVQRELGQLIRNVDEAGARYGFSPLCGLPLEEAVTRVSPDEELHDALVWAIPTYCIGDR